jgi:hypothetical protein
LTADIYKEIPTHKASPKRQVSMKCEYALEGCKRLFVHGVATKAAPMPMNGSLE